MRKSSVERMPSCYRVTLASHVAIPPLSEAVISIKIEGDRDNTQCVMLESPASEKGCQVDVVYTSWHDLGGHAEGDYSS